MKSKKLILGIALLVIGLVLEIVLCTSVDVLVGCLIGMPIALSSLFFIVPIAMNSVMKKSSTIPYTATVDEVKSFDTSINNDIYRERKKRICSLSGWRGSITVYEDHIFINENISLSNIKSVYLSPSTVMSRGFLQIILPGDTPSPSIEAALKAKNTVLLHALGQNDAALAIKQCIEKLKAMDIEIQKKRVNAILGKYGANTVTKGGAVLTSTGIVYDVFDTVSTYEAWSIKDTKFISYEDIDFFSLKGSLQQETAIHGGGLNLKGAVVGGLLFGGVGALLGGQLGTNTYSFTKNIDDRFVYARSSKSSYDIIVALGKEVDDTLIKLRKIIPEKEYSSEQGFKKEAHTAATDSIKTTTLSDELKTLKQLLDEGILTQEEFDAKKKQLLGL